MTIYTRFGCIECQKTKLTAKAFKLVFNEVNVDEEPEALANLKDMGFGQLPVVLHEGQMWSGHQPDVLKRIAMEA
ncbi:NrdH-redoxin [Periweissella cryptocerci]|uniref:NrdH-redoxin n=1 Tax=Periweissella cryptocerci TaxID=2506420 RepID=A0A4P6YWI9_9LACO|nr:glutaredoxin domain-containing protein [Periweissella cryptocerci]QBO37269.1 NrdH-redoxin [Periweissella cryptocerci]